MNTRRNGDSMHITPFPMRIEREKRIVGLALFFHDLFHFPNIITIFADTTLIISKTWDL